MTSWTLYNFGGYPKCLKWSSQSRISSTSPKRECVQPPNRFEPRFEPVLFGAFGPPTGSPYRFEPVNPVPHYDIFVQHTKKTNHKNRDVRRGQTSLSINFS